MIQGFKHFYKFYISLGLLFLIVLMGMVGYMSIEGMSWLNALYMTVITVATVGFREVHPLSEAGMLFTIFLIITSFGTFAYAITSLTAYVMDGEFNRYFQERRMSNAIEKLEGHVIICGYGRNGRQAAHVLKNHNQRFVVIENKKEIVETLTHRFSDLVISDDATKDETLEKAGIKKASALITTLPMDADNLFIVLSARTLNPKLCIISRASDDNSDKKLKTAGADNVIMPDKIGGAHMASLVLKPDVIEFLDVITGQGGDTINLEEITFENLPEQLRNHSIKDLEVRNRSGANIIGFKTGNGEYIINPSADTKIIPGAKLFVLGTSDQIRKLKEIFS